MSPLRDLHWVALPSARDDRGVLTAVESGRDVPFEVRRVFWMHHVTDERGGHAHRDTDQVVVAAAGAFRIEVSDGGDSATFELDDPTRGLYVPRLLFTRLHGFSPGAVCLVLASTHYDMSRSIRSWDDYLREIGGPRQC